MQVILFPLKDEEKLMENVRVSVFPLPLTLVSGRPFTVEANPVTVH